MMRGLGPFDPGSNPGIPTYYETFLKQLYTK